MSQNKCPHCDKEIPVAAFTHFQAAKFTWRLTPTKGHAIQLKTIGGSLLALDKLLRASAKELGVKIHILVTGFKTSEDGSLEVEMLEAKELPGDRP